MKRLEKVKPIVFKDELFWSDILLRHSGDKMSPKEMKEMDKNHYDHCMGNFSGMVYQILD